MYKSIEACVRKKGSCGTQKRENAQQKTCEEIYVLCWNAWGVTLMLPHGWTQYGTKKKEAQMFFYTRLRSTFLFFHLQNLEVALLWRVMKERFFSFFAFLYFSLSLTSFSSLVIKDMEAKNFRQFFLMIFAFSYFIYFPISF